MTTKLDAAASGTHVLVTGATGYIAGWLIKRLLDAGAHVHAAVRDPSGERKIAHLNALADAAPGTIAFFKADLLDDRSHDAAMAGCEIVFHTASPFVAQHKISDPQRTLVDPALNGTRSVLDSANRTPSVRRVVLTSSCAAISGADGPQRVLTEADWNNSSTLDNAPYLYSKTLAERAAWEMAEAQDRWQLVVINPALVLGPGTAESQTSASFDYVRGLGDGSFPDAPPPIELGTVDVRDVAEAHYIAAFDPAAEGRNIIFNDVHSLGQLADILKAEFGDAYAFPRNTAHPDGAPRWQVDNSKSKTKLGMHYRPTAPAVIAMFQAMIDRGEIVPA